MSNTTSKFAKDYLQKRGYAKAGPKISRIKGTPDIYVNWKHKSVLELLTEDKEFEDPIEIIIKRSRNLVLKAFNAGWVGPPFNMSHLASLMGYKVTPNELISEARIIPENDSFIIEYNPFQSTARTNFSIAHEIAHTLFTDCADTIRYRKNHLESGSWELEFLCNIGASELLLPYAEFTTTANSIDPTISNIISLARDYQASVESVFLRLCTVVDYPCTVAICSYNREGELIVSYSQKSKESNLVLEKGSKIDFNSSAYECKRPGWTSYGVESWEEFNGEEFNVESVGLSPIRKQLVPRVGILISPSKFVKKRNKGIYLVSGDATEPRGDNKKIIVQIVNNHAGVGFGFGKALAKKYKETKSSLQNWKKDKNNFKLGETNLVRVDFDIIVFQILAQDGLYPKDGNIPLKYSSLRDGLISLRKYIEQNPDYTVHMPPIGSGQAKGNWNIIKGIIYDELASYGINVTIYFLPNNNVPPPNINQSLILKEVDEE
ncbi:ImmA/IrrE family metallo-endopeptidase [Muricauda oceani]|uniref:ImmA/IrrE family metallo-endopeptidase n=1 Tax=Flagellimonas oceani TaxID=2698672 RepID=A0A6G7J7B9_9FLAO|nr:ImmA/IrrE family metallo-endopeptidase [Allomuricauda oceani]MBW8242570.1 ImmA/IrrE family metallo-endopeptidase [Allomuricauda oceani]QII46327.1 ImmA/IrrE family metallo-endopeptidase [Allomuricauda oceani]